MISERGKIIATNQPYGATEKWESTFVCEPKQFVQLKFESIDITKIANDILKIQFLTDKMS